MTRHLLAAAAVPLLLLGSARAQTRPAPAAPPPAAAPSPAVPPAAAAPPAGAQLLGAPPPAAPAAGGTPTQAEIDRQIQEAVQREVAKVREQLRDEMRAEMQGQQSVAAFLGSEEKEKRKLEFLELNGYYRFRWDLYSNFGMDRYVPGTDTAIFPPPILSSTGTQTSGNMRFRFDPTFNISEEIRLRSTIDLLDNVVFGSNPYLGTRNSIDFTTGSQVSPTYNANYWTNAINITRVWAEVQTPVGLLSFGRMPSQWGMGILANAGNGLDQDQGDSVDRIQFAIPFGFLGGITLIPMYTWYSTGVVLENPIGNVGMGQPVAIEQATNVGAFGLKLARQDSPEEVRRRLAKGLSSINGGIYFSYRSQRYALPLYKIGDNPYVSPPVNRDADAFVLDLYFKLESKHWLLETELVGITGTIGNAAQAVPDTTNPNCAAGAANPAQCTYVLEPNLGPVKIQQWGGALRGVYKFGEGKIRVGAELGVASGDSNPGFGNYPGRNPYPAPGSFDGRQYAPGDTTLSLNNFRFNPAYYVDLILWRSIIGGVTDGWYAKPTFRWEFLEGMVATAQVIYSQAMQASSTPSTVNKSLGIEADLGFTYTSDDGFVAFLQYGILKPLSGFDFPPGQTGGSLALVMQLHTGLAVKF
jgi:uncharacterized protein (TIGR04551 family)